MGKIDCLFLHVPKWVDYYRPFNHFLWINFLPMGLLALADLLQRHGVSTQVLHLGLEKIVDSNFSLLSYLREQSPRIVALDLHWHPQCYDVMETVKEIKSAFPKIYVLLGGWTASFFHEEIMRNFDGVDGVIRGEAELPLLELSQALLREKGDLFPVPNLTWRMKGRILVNPLSYVATERDLSSLSFTNLSLLRNYTAYVRYVGQSFCLRDISKKRTLRRYSSESPVFHLPIGRGCPVQCTWCSGSCRSQQMISGRKEVIFRDPDDVLTSIREAISFGYEHFHICFDPYPQDPDYFTHLFSRIREERLQVECRFESFGLPTPNFVQAFKETFPGPKSVLVLSPGVGASRLRTIHKGYAYTNKALFECLDLLEKHGVWSDLIFTLGVPFETKEDVEQTYRLQRRIRARYSRVKAIRTFPMTMEPGSPLHLDPEAYGVRTSLQSFMDFYRYHSGGKQTSSLGYWIPYYSSEVHDEKGFEKVILKMRCRYFCSYHPNADRSSTPFWGRRYCDLSRLFSVLNSWMKPRL